MMTDLLRRDVEARTGKRTYAFREVTRIIYNLGGSCADGTIRERLRPSSIRLADLGIKLSYRANVTVVYPQEEVWTFL